MTNPATTNLVHSIVACFQRNPDSWTLETISSGNASMYHLKTSAPEASFSEIVFDGENVIVDGIITISENSEKNCIMIILEKLHRQKENEEAHVLLDSFDIPKNMRNLASCRAYEYFIRTSNPKNTESSGWVRKNHKVFKYFVKHTNGLSLGVIDTFDILCISYNGRHIIFPIIEPIGKRFAKRVKTLKDA